MTVPTVETATLTTGGSAFDTFTVNMPATRPDDDFYLLIATKDGSGDYVKPSGWTDLQLLNDGSDISFIAVWRIGASEPSTYALDLQGATEAVSCTIYRISGVDNADPIDIDATSSGSGSNQVAPTVTVSQADNLVIRSITVDRDSVTATQPTNDHNGTVGSGGNANGFGYSHEDGPASGPTGTAQFTHSSDEFISSTIAIKEGAAPAGGGRLLLINPPDLDGGMGGGLSL